MKNTLHSFYNQFGVAKERRLVFHEATERGPEVKGGGQPEVEGGGVKGAKERIAASTKMQLPKLELNLEGALGEMQTAIKKEGTRAEEVRGDREAKLGELTNAAENLLYEMLRGKHPEGTAFDQEAVATLAAKMANNPAYQKALRDYAQANPLGKESMARFANLNVDYFTPEYQKSFSQLAQKRPTGGSEALAMQ